MYPGGSQATTGGGPDIGRPPTPPGLQNAQAALQRAFAQNKTQMANPNSKLSQAVGNQQSQLSKGSARSLATKAMQAAAKRRLQRGT